MVLPERGERRDPRQNISSATKVTIFLLAGDEVYIFNFLEDQTGQQSLKTRPKITSLEVSFFELIQNKRLVLLSVLLTSILIPKA